MNSLSTAVFDWYLIYVAECEKHSEMVLFSTITNKIKKVGKKNKTTQTASNKF